MGWLFHAYCAGRGNPSQDTVGLRTNCQPLRTSTTLSNRPSFTWPTTAKPEPDPLLTFNVGAVTRTIPAGSSAGVVATERVPSQRVRRVSLRVFMYLACFTAPPETNNLRLFSLPNVVKPEALFFQSSCNPRSERLRRPIAASQATSYDRCPKPNRARKNRVSSGQS